MTHMTRFPSITQRVTWQDRKFYVIVGFGGTDHGLSEVAYADGQKTGTDLQTALIDACALISRALAGGATLTELADEATTGGAVAAILVAMKDGEAGGWA
jgi:hypothetical protein